MWEIDSYILALIGNHLLDLIKHFSVATVDWINHEVLDLLQYRLSNSRFHLTKKDLLLNWIRFTSAFNNRCRFAFLQSLNIRLHFPYLANNTRQVKPLLLLGHHDNTFHDFKLFTEVSLLEFTNIDSVLYLCNVVSHVFQFLNCCIRLFCLFVNQA